MWVAPNDICNSSDSALNIIQRTFLTIAGVMSMSISVSAVTGAFNQSSFEVDCLPFLNILNQLLTVL